MERLSRLIFFIYRASRELPFIEFQDGALELTKQAIPFDACTWGTASFSPKGLLFYSLHLHKEHPDRVQLYEEMRHHDPVPELVKAHPGRMLNIHPPSFYRGAQHRGIRDYAHRCGHQNSLVAGWIDERGLTAWIGLYRADPNAHFSEEQRQSAEYLIPRLMEALAVSRELQAARLRAVNKNGRHQVAVADQLGVPYFADPGFPELLRREGPDWAGPHFPRPLCAAIANRQCTVYRGANVVIRIDEMKELIFLRARAMGPVDRLTARELDAARHVADGRTYKEIARLLGIAPATARNHIQRIHERLHIHNNAELAAQLQEHAA